MLFFTVGVLINSKFDQNSQYTSRVILKTETLEPLKIQIYRQGTI